MFSSSIILTLSRREREITQCAHAQWLHHVDGATFTYSTDVTVALKSSVTQPSAGAGAGLFISGHSSGQISRYPHKRST